MEEFFSTSWEWPINFPRKSVILKAPWICTWMESVWLVYLSTTDSLWTNWNVSSTYERQLQWNSLQRRKDGAHNILLAHIASNLSPSLIKSEARSSANKARSVKYLAAESNPLSRAEDMKGFTQIDKFNWNPHTHLFAFIHQENGSRFKGVCV